jgi:hypothetical protein
MMEHDNKLRKLTIRPRIGTGDFKLIQRDFTNAIPENLKAVLREYAGLAVEENTFTDKKSRLWILQSFQNTADLHKLPKEFLDAKWGQWIPFAYDPGGWHFCLSMSDDDYNSVYINRWTDHKPEDQFIKIADSFEEFIDGLRREDEMN